MYSYYRGILFFVYSLYYWNCLKVGIVSIKILKILFIYNYIKIWNNYKGMIKFIFKLLWIILRLLKNVCFLLNNSLVIIKFDFLFGFILINLNISVDF